jgi:hypothetical protein
MLLHEFYVFEERLKKFFEAVRLMAPELGVHEYDSSHHGKIIRLYSRSFKYALTARGNHVHRDDFEPREISSIGTLELLSAGTQDRIWSEALPQRSLALVALG